MLYKYIRFTHYNWTKNLIIQNPIFFVMLTLKPFFLYIDRFLFDPDFSHKKIIFYRIYFLLGGLHVVTNMNEKKTAVNKSLNIKKSNLTFPNIVWVVCLFVCFRYIYGRFIELFPIYQEKSSKNSSLYGYNVMYLNTNVYTIVHVVFVYI